MLIVFGLYLSLVVALYLSKGVPKLVLGALYVLAMPTLAITLTLLGEPFASGYFTAWTVYFISEIIKVVRKPKEIV